MTPNIFNFNSTGLRVKALRNILLFGNILLLCPFMFSKALFLIYLPWIFLGLLFTKVIIVTTNTEHDMPFWMLPAAMMVWPYVVHLTKKNVL